jgi:broad specificity phosphatase PhoE
MAPNRILFIRHAEKPHKPPCDDDDGVRKTGEKDDESLTVRGWQRAGALVHFFASQQPLKPQTIFAAGVGHKSPSRRPRQTVAPLANWLNIEIKDGHLKDDIQGLSHDLMKQTGIVLVCWEHELIADIVALLPNAPKVPQDWRDIRFDIVWVLDADGAGWKFTQVPQMLLAGDSAKPIT